jgi:hypothetical protein
MRVIAAPERDVQCPRDESIGCEGSLAGQQPRILDALDARADVLRPQPKADIRGFTSWGIEPADVLPPMKPA